MPKRSTSGEKISCDSVLTQEKRISDRSPMFIVAYESFLILQMG